jgi:16S rRNA processing protein RimM
LLGEMRVQAFAPGAPNLQPGRSVYLAGARHSVRRAREDRGQWILQVEGIETREAAAELRGTLIEALDSEVERDDPESYFLHELVGLEVVTAEGERLGRITEVMQPGGNDVYVVEGPRGELLIPAIGDVVASIDVPTGLMTITPLPGLLDESK